MSHDLEALLKLVLAGALAAVLGWERAATGKQAGLRTHMLVGMSAALFVALADGVVEHFGRDSEHIRYDPIRVLEAVVAGISFLGAGTIFVSRDKGETVKGLTTAAAIWATAGVGAAAGLGRPALATGATGLIFVVLQLLGRWEQRAEGGVGPGKRSESDGGDGA